MRVRLTGCFLSKDRMLLLDKNNALHVPVCEETGSRLHDPADCPVSFTDITITFPLVPEEMKPLWGLRPRNTNKQLLLSSGF